jgi:hypothetical protein
MGSRQVGRWAVGSKLGDSAKSKLKTQNAKGKTGWF